MQPKGSQTFFWGSTEALGKNTKQPRWTKRKMKGGKLRKHPGKRSKTDTPLRRKRKKMGAGDPAKPLKMGSRGKKVDG